MQDLTPCVALEQRDDQDDQQDEDNRSDSDVHGEPPSWLTNPYLPEPGLAKHIRGGKDALMRWRRPGQSGDVIDARGGGGGFPGVGGSLLRPRQAAETEPEAGAKAPG
jgi:hypothetical protein